MRLLRLIQNKIEPVEAFASPNKKKQNEKNAKCTFCITHGSFGNGLWNIKTYLHTRSFPLGNPGDKIKLEGDDFTFSAIRKDNKFIKDQKGNFIYIISKDNSKYDINTIILFWNLPILPNAEVTYSLHGSARLIAEGTFGKFHIDNLIKTPAPIIEITGDCKLEWYIKDYKHNTITTQSITYDSQLDSWDMSGKTIDKIEE